MAPRVLIVVARQFNGHELWCTLHVLNKYNIEYEVISTQQVITDEVTFESVRIKRTIDDVDVEEVNSFNGLMIISGNMKDTEAYWKHQKVLSYVRQNQPKPTAAICCSVPTIREAARKKRVSFFPLVRSRLLLEQAGAICVNVTITVDGNLVTAENQMGTEVWAECFASLLLGQEPQLGLTETTFRPKARKSRKTPPEITRLREQALRQTQ